MTHERTRMQSHTINELLLLQRTNQVYLVYLTITIVLMTILNLKKFKNDGTIYLHTCFWKSEYEGSSFKLLLCNNTCSFCIFIGRELCVIKVHTHGWRQLMAWSNLANLFRGSLHDFCQLYYNIKQIDFIFLCFCTVIDHRWRHSVWRTKSHALDCVSCRARPDLVRTFLFFTRYDVIYYSTDARKNEIYLLNNTGCIKKV